MLGSSILLTSLGTQAARAGMSEVNSFKGRSGKVEDPDEWIFSGPNWPLSQNPVISSVLVHVRSDKYVYKLDFLSI
jgi:hypothetical protein